LGVVQNPNVGFDGGEVDVLVVAGVGCIGATLLRGKSAFSALHEVVNFLGYVEELGGRADHVPVGVEAQALADGNEGPEYLRDASSDGSAVDVNDALAFHASDQAAEFLDKTGFEEFRIRFKGNGV
jgi:hypothetical protein